MSNNRPDIWGGIECTINRVGDNFFDQLQLNGHYDRICDIDAIANLGIKVLRYPLLWEKHQPVEEDPIDFTWALERIEKLTQCGIEPIIGLVHHGSGPSFTNLLDPKFPEKLAAYARAVAEQFPNIKYYTPVNEPLTTARFSGLYGLWYPHKDNDVCFLKILLNQLKGVVLSMQEIRKVNPGAKLIQTEDLSKTYSTSLLKYQADFENNRRWLTYDILTGRLVETHPLWKYFKRLGIEEKDLRFFIENPCVPDIIGANFYVTSERYIDEKKHLYPESSHGGNELHNYADVEAVRVKINDPHGFPVLAKELWERYHLPIAVTEAHLHSAREEQLIWFKEIYDTSTKLRESGIGITAVTSWALLGSYGWNNLLASEPFEYERGAFDLSSGKLRPTAMAGLIKKLIEHGDFVSPATNKPGWWNRTSRYFNHDHHLIKTQFTAMNQPILIIGKRGTLGKAFARICHSRHLDHVLVGREEVDICSMEDIENVIIKYNPWAIVNAAGYVRVDDAEDEKLKCYRENTNGPRQLASACRRYGLKLLTFSSDLVFSGAKKSPYFESDPVSPLNIYGRSKAQAEMMVSSIHPRSLIIRTSSFFGPWDEYNFISKMLKDISMGKEVKASEDITITPTYIPHLVNASIDLLIDDESGIWHLTNHDQVTWHSFAEKAIRHAGINPELLKPVTRIQSPALRPVNSALHSEKGILLPDLSQAMNEYFTERTVEV